MNTFRPQTFETPQEQVVAQTCTVLPKENRVRTKFNRCIASLGVITSLCARTAAADPTTLNEPPECAHARQLMHDSNLQEVQTMMQLCAKARTTQRSTAVAAVRNQQASAPPGKQAAAMPGAKAAPQPPVTAPAPAVPSAPSASTPGRLPDIIGIRTGMTLDEALAVLKQHNPNMQIRTDGTRVNAEAKTGAEIDSIRLALTPRSPQIVASVTRRFSTDKPIAAVELLAQLSQKYGPSTWDAPVMHGVAYGSNWLFDEQGRPLGKACTPGPGRRRCIGLEVKVDMAVAAPLTNFFSMSMSNPWLAERAAHESQDLVAEQRKAREEQQREQAMQTALPRL